MIERKCWAESQRVEHSAQLPETPTCACVDSAQHAAYPPVRGVVHASSMPPLLAGLLATCHVCSTLSTRWVDARRVTYGTFPHVPRLEPCLRLSPHTAQHFQISLCLS